MKFPSVLVCVMITISCQVCDLSDSRHPNRVISLMDGEYASLMLKRGHHYQVALTNVSANASFVIFQAHSQREQISVSLTSVWTRGSSKNGTDVGVTSFLDPGQQDVTWYLWLDGNTTNSARVHVAVSTYTKYDPVPGGCNMEMTLQNDSNIALGYNTYKTDVKFSAANIAADRQGHRKDAFCGNATTQSLLTYHVYLYYMKEGELGGDEFSSSLKKMATVADIQTHGKLLRTIKYPSRTAVSVTSRPGQGVVYAVIVKQTGGATAAYVPAVTYACSFKSKVNNCYALTSISTDILCTVGGIVGLFLCFLGHRFFKTEMFLFGFMAAALISFILVARFSSFSGAVQVVVTLIGGAVGGGLWLLLWCLCGLPVLSVLLVGLVYGYMMTSFIFNVTPLGNLPLWSTSFTYGMVFTCGVLLFPAILLAFTKVLNIVSCAVVGGYAGIVAVDVYLHTNFSFIVINSIKKAIVPGFTDGFVTMQFQVGDILLLLSWFLLAVAGCTVQFYRERRKPPFPPCPYQIYKFKRDSHATIDACGSSHTAVNVPTSAHDTDPLLSPKVDGCEGQTNSGAPSQGHDHHGPDLATR